MNFLFKVRFKFDSLSFSTKGSASMIRSSLVGRWVLALMVLIAGSASLPAVDLYVTGWKNGTQKNVFGKIDSATGVYTELNSDVGGGFNNIFGLTWNPGISQFNTLFSNGTLSTISLTGTVGSVIANGVTSNAALAYNPTTSTMYDLGVYSGGALRTLNPSTGTESYIGGTGATNIYGATFVNGTFYGTANVAPLPNFDFRYGSINVSTGLFTAINGSSDSQYGYLGLAFDGTTLFGLQRATNTLYTMNPSTGTLSFLTNVTGAPDIFTVAVPFAVPEPSTYALVAIAMGVMATIARRRRVESSV